MSTEDCTIRIRLLDQYTQSLADYKTAIDALREKSDARREDRWVAAEASLAASQRAWNALERHIVDHHCLELGWSKRGPDDSAASTSILEKAAICALDLILVADDERRFVDVNAAAAEVLGLPRNEIAGRLIEDFFAEARGQTIPDAWEDFVANGVQCGICELKTPGKRRLFDYRAKANFASGLHLSVLREQPH